MSEDKDEDMEKEYDFSKGKPSRFAKLLKNEKQQITIRLDLKTIIYFKCMAEEKDISYQNLINFYLRNCVEEKRELKMSWDQEPSSVSKPSRYIGVTMGDGKLVGFSDQNPLEKQTQETKETQGEDLEER